MMSEHEQPLLSVNVYVCREKEREREAPLVVTELEMMTICPKHSFCQTVLESRPMCFGMFFGVWFTNVVARYILLSVANIIL